MFRLVTSQPHVTELELIMKIFKLSIFIDKIKY